MKRPVCFGVDTTPALVSSYSPKGSGVIVRSPRRRGGPTLPHCEAKVSVVGSP